MAANVKISRARLQSGFTLLELLVALAVFAVMGTAAYSGLRSVLTTRAVVEAQARRLAAIQLAFHVLQQDITQMLPRSIRDEYGDQEAALESGRMGGDWLVFTRTGWDNPLTQPRSNLQRLSYRLEQGTLVRRYWTVLDRNGAGEPQETVLLENVQQVKARFLDDQDEWQKQWPPEGENTTDAANTEEPLPRAVEISLTLGDWGEITRLFILSGA